MIDEKTLSVYDSRIAEYVDLVNTPPSNALINFISIVKKGGIVLDLGCGPGNASKQMKQKGLVPHAVDASMEMVQFVKKSHGIDAKFMCFSQLSAIDFYDGVYANFSLLHTKKKIF